MRDRLAERTGYPQDLLTDDVDLEGDLGIDSVLRAEIWAEILEKEGLDPKTRPSRVRSIGELSKVLAEAAAQPAGQAVVADEERGAEEATGEAAGPAPCVLNRPRVVALPDHEVASFTTRRVLHFTGHPRTDESVARMLAARDIEVDSMDASVAAGDGASLDRMLGRCDTIVYSAHGGLASGRAKAGRLAGSLERETLKLFGVFRAIKRHLEKMPRRIVIPVSLDGCFGLEDAGGSLLAAFPAGFVLSLQRELPECTFQLVDAGDRAWSDTLAEHLDIVTGPTLVGRRGDGLVTIEHEPAAESERGPLPIDESDTVLVTGGARGIVFACVRALARATGCRLVLTGRTEPPAGDEPWLDADESTIDAEIQKVEVELVRSEDMNLGDARRTGRRMRSQWELDQNLRSLEAEGIEVRYETCDVSAVDDLRKLLRRLSRRDERITAVVHGAGVQRSAMIENLPDDRVLATLATKLHPLFVLGESLDWSALKLFVSFGSITGAFGNEGQTDYALANNLLAAAGRVLGREHPDARVQTIEWTAWAGTGMVTDREAEGFREQGLTVLDIDSGVDLFLDAVAGLPEEPQVSVFNPGSAFTMPRARAMRRRRSSLLEGGTLTARFSPKTDTFLEQHMLNGQPVVPGTFIIELFCEATSSQHPAALESVHFRRPMWIRREDHGVEVIMEGDHLRALPEQRPDVPARALTNLQYASAVIGEPAPTIDLPPMAGDDEVTTLRARSGKGEGTAFYTLLDDAFRDALSTGPIFRGLKATVNDEDRCVGLIEITPAAAEQFLDEPELLFDPIVSDMAVQVASSWAMERLMVMAIPAEVERVEVLGTLAGPEALVCCSLHSMDEDRTVVDLVIRDLDGAPRYAMKRLTLRSIARFER
jgi:NAD(P)-dependent dehydrogenase (short-subunit alcohol dehydrogenase family)